MAENMRRDSLNADEFARRVVARLDGSASVLSPEDAELLAQCGVTYNAQTPVFFDPEQVDQLQVVSAALRRNYGGKVRVFLPHVDES